MMNLETSNYELLDVTTEVNSLVNEISSYSDSSEEVTDERDLLISLLEDIGVANYSKNNMNIAEIKNVVRNIVKDANKKVSYCKDQIKLYKSAINLKEVVLMDKVSKMDNPLLPDYEYDRTRERVQAINSEISECQSKINLYDTEKENLENILDKCISANEICLHFC